MGKLPLYRCFLHALVVVVIVSAVYVAALQDQQKSTVDLQKIADEMQGSDPFKHDSPQDELEDQSEDNNQQIIQTAGVTSPLKPHTPTATTENSTGSVSVPSLTPTSSSQSSWKYKSNKPTKFAATLRPSRFMPKQKVPTTTQCTLSHIYTALCSHM